MVAENEMQIGLDGTVKVEIDAADHQGNARRSRTIDIITAEVMDDSRRTISGTGKRALSPSKPFKVTAGSIAAITRRGTRFNSHFYAHTLDEEAGLWQGRTAAAQDRLRQRCQARGRRWSSHWEVEPPMHEGSIEAKS